MRLKALGKASGKAPALREFDWVAAADDFLKSRREGTLDNPATDHIEFRIRENLPTLRGGALAICHVSRCSIAVTAQ